MAIKNYKHTQSVADHLEKLKTNILRRLAGLSSTLRALVHWLNTTVHTLLDNAPELRTVVGIATYSLQIITKDRFFRKNVWVKELYNLFKSLQYSKLLDWFLINKFSNFSVAIMRFFVDLSINFWASGLWFSSIPCPQNPLFIIWLFLWIDALEQTVRSQLLASPSIADKTRAHDRWSQSLDFLEATACFSLGLLSFSGQYLSLHWSALIAVILALESLKAMNFSATASLKEDERHKADASESDIFEKIAVVHFGRELLRMLREYALSHLPFHGNIPLSVLLGCTFYYLSSITKECLVLLSALIEKCLSLLHTSPLAWLVEGIDAMVVQCASLFFGTPFGHIYYPDPEEDSIKSQGLSAHSPTLVAQAQTSPLHLRSEPQVALDPSTP